MSVSIYYQNKWHEIGSASFLHCFFSTISYNLEPKGWGTEYPILMNEFYSGKLIRDKLQHAIRELNEIENRFNALSQDKVIWDIEKMDAKPPWGISISKDIDNLGNYFITSDGQNLFSVLRSAFKEALALNSDVSIQ